MMRNLSNLKKISILQFIDLNYLNYCNYLLVKYNGINPRITAIPIPIQIEKATTRTPLNFILKILLFFKPI